ncbi:MAG: SpoIIE family protein phosphatase [Clostridia bacterium]|nr:SpoIIE family protein phosphatase [Clostridia bacterium]
MFQGVAGDFAKKNHNKDVKYNQIEVKDLVMKLFSVRNIIIYIIAFLVSMVSFGGDEALGIAPFSLSIVAASASCGIPISVVYIATILGSFVGLGPDATGSYFLISIVFFITLFILRAKKQEDVNEKAKFGKNIVLSIILVKVVPMLFSSINISQLIISTMLCITTYIFYKIFVNSLDVVYEYGYKAVFSVEELMGAAVLLAIAISALNPISILGYSLKNILCILIVLILGWKSGILLGTVGGVTIGVVLGIIGNEPPIVVAAFAIAGMLSGILSKIGRLGVIIGFIVGNIVITYFSNGNLEPIIVFQEILIASLGLLLIPKNLEYVMDDLFDNSSILPETTKKTLNTSKETVNKLSSMSETIAEIAKSYTQVAATVVEIDEKKNEVQDENKEIFEEELKNNLEGLEENILYQDIITSNEIAGDIYDCLKNKNKLSKDILIAIFAKHNNYIIGVEDGNINRSIEDDINNMIEAINKAYDVEKMNFILKKKIDEKNQNMRNQLENVSEAISDLAEDIENENSNKYSEKKQLINKILKQKGIDVSEVKIKENDSKRKIINIYTKNEECKQEACEYKKIEKVLTKVFAEPIVMQKKKCSVKNDTEECAYRFTSKDKYDLKIGIARAKKHDSLVSGDSSIQSKLNDGKYLLAISDGKGSGPEARKCSKVAIKMLEKMLSSGFKKDVSVKMINSTLTANMEEDMYATLDIAIFDLYQGNIEFIKNGACPTYIKRNKEVELVNSVALPTGIMSEVEFVTFEKDIKEGDIIVMCSDGIVESNGDFMHKELWLKYFMEEIQTDDVQQIADLIISEAIDNNYGKEKDDMTVIVAKVSK